MSGHTPGPWDDKWGDVNGGPDGKTLVIYTGEGEFDDEEGKANLRLIKASPDLLQELKTIVKCLEPLELFGLIAPGLATLNGARSVIDKAEGVDRG